MKTIFYILILFIFLTGCYSIPESEISDTEKTKAELFSNDFIENEIKSDFEIINLDPLQNFNGLLDKMEELSCLNKIIGLKFTLNDSIYYLTGFTGCPTNGGTACYFNNNTLIIKNDSIKNLSGDWDKMVAIHNLGKEIKKITTIDYHFQFNKEILKPALIHLYIENKYPITKTKEVLHEIVQEFEKINLEMGNDYFQYSIIFERFSMLDIPPPPPPPEMQEK